MRFEYAAAAIDEIDEALAHYRAIDPGLCARMVSKIEDSLQSTQRFPEGW